MYKLSPVVNVLPAVLLLASVALIIGSVVIVVEARSNLATPATTVVTAPTASTRGSAPCHPSATLAVACSTPTSPACGTDP